MIAIVQLGFFYPSSSLWDLPTPTQTTPFFFTSQLSFIFQLHTVERSLCCRRHLCYIQGKSKEITGDTLYCFWWPRFHRYCFDHSNSASFVRDFLQGGFIRLDSKENNRKKGMPLSTSYLPSSFIYSIFRGQQTSVLDRVSTTSALPNCVLF